MFVIGGTGEAGFIDPKPLKPQELVCRYDLEASTWHPKGSSTAGDPLPWNLVYISLFKIDSQSIGVLWYDTTTAAIEESKDESENAVAASSSNSQNLQPRQQQRLLRVSTYNFIENTWRSIRLVAPSPSRQPCFNFGATLVPIFDKHVTIREQVENVSKVKPRADGPVPLTKLIIFGGINLDEHQMMDQVAPG